MVSRYATRIIMHKTKWPISDDLGLTKWPIYDDFGSTKWPISDDFGSTKWPISDDFGLTKWPISDDFGFKGSPVIQKPCSDENTHASAAVVTPFGLTKFCRLLAD